MRASRDDPHLGAADAAWWRMEEPDNQMVITGVLTFGTPLDAARLERRVRERMLPLVPFHSRLREPRFGLGRPRWSPDPAFSLARHLHQVRLPPPAGDSELQALVSRLMSQPLDPRRPLWQLYRVERCAGGSALVARVHHCIADGMALIQLLLTLDDVAGNEGPAHLGWNGPPRPAAPPRGVGAGVRAGAALARLVLLPPDPRGTLGGRLGVEKQAAWCDAVPLEELRAVARASGATLNDLLAAAVAGALRRYLRGRGGARLRSLRALVPVNLRAADDAGVLGNRFGVVFLRLPVGEGDPGRRLRCAAEAMRRLKSSPQAGVTHALLRLFGPAGRAVVRLAVWFLGMKGSLVFTNVPGPREAVSVCGAPLTRLMAWVPQSGRLALGVSAVSYAGRLQLGISADRGVVPDLAALVEAFRSELAELIAPAALPQPV